GDAPSGVTQTEKPCVFAKRDGLYEVRLRLPFATKGDIGLFKKGDELVVEVGTLRRHIGLPRSMASLVPARARLENRTLTVEMKEAQLANKKQLNRMRPSLLRKSAACAAKL